MSTVLPARNRITCRSDRAGVEYHFADDGIELALCNRSEAPLVFFIVLAEQFDALQGPNGDWSRQATEAAWDEVRCYRSDAVLEIVGADRVWGPWQGTHQVVEVKLEAGESRGVGLHIDRVTDKEREAIAELYVAAQRAHEGRARIASPQEFQVFQRTSPNSGPVLVSGQVSAGTTGCEFRVAGGAGSAAPLPDWSPLTFDSQGRFNEVRHLPSGGWYRLDLRTSGPEGKSSTTSVARFGVGEVFVVAGQSNSTNSGEHRTTQQSGLVAAFDGTAWSLANDPLPGVADRTQGGSCWPAFGDALSARTGLPVGIASTGFGGTSVAQWRPHGDLLDGTVSRMRALGPAGFRALLWHQGESDYLTPGEVYFSRLRETICCSRLQAGWEVPWMVAQASYHNAEHPAFDHIRKAQERLWREGIAHEGPDTDQLQGDHRDLGGRGIHFSPRGLKAHGEAWAELVGDYIDSVVQPRTGAVNE
ncbi:sialate O-acetylesterase [Posidoniimonas polymericola]|nr:sialate O-acetylesterase [Posidoniimonas polymericola]